MLESIGVEFYQVFQFTRQLGLALVGASSLWACVFLWIGGRRKADESPEQAEKRKKVLEWTGRRLVALFSVGFVLASASWFILWNSWPVLAHEGITLFPAEEQYRRAFMLTAPVYIAWILLTALGALVLRLSKPDFFRQALPWFFGIQFLFASFLISLYAWTGEILSSHQIFFYFHGFHSIFTVGTVLTLDFLFLSSRMSILRQQVLFPFFPTISKIIFIGLGLDFLSVFLVFGDAIEISSRFFLAQTAVGILIINGTIMAGPLTRKILAGLAEGKMLEGSWKILAGICGPISIVSWLTITFIDYFPNLTLSYPAQFLIYASVIVLGIITKIIIDKLDEKRGAPTNESLSPSYAVSPDEESPV